MFDMSLPVGEAVLRVVIIYFFVLIGLRLSGKKQVGEMSPFDLVVLLILSETVSQAINGGDESVTGGIVLAGTLLLINHLVAIITFKNKKIEKVTQGEPQILIHNGKVNRQVADKQKITHDEILETLRGKNIFNILDVEYGILETNGTLSVKKTKRAKSRGQDDFTSESPQLADRVT